MVSAGAQEVARDYVRYAMAMMRFQSDWNSWSAGIPGGAAVFVVKGMLDETPPECDAGLD